MGTISRWSIRRLFCKINEQGTGGEAQPPPPQDKEDKIMRVEFRYWTEGSGYSHSETVDVIDDHITAEEYIGLLDDKDACFSTGADAINVEMYDGGDNLVSEYFWEKEEQA